MLEEKLSNQFVTFKIENELYAIDVFKIREILEVPDITKVPGMPERIRGVINIRGSVVPVVDLKIQFGLEPTTCTQDTAVIVTEITNEDELFQIGIMVDEAQEVITLEEVDIEEPPKIGLFIDNRFLEGMGKVGDDFIIILNINRILTEEEIAKAAETAQTVAEETEETEE